MLKILVPTDFSKAADNALDWAIELANQYGSSLSLLHIYQVPSATGALLSIEEYIKENAEKDMAMRLQYTMDRLKAKKVVETKTYRGYTVPFITNMAESDDFDLVVMGMKGVSALEEVFIGSTANGVLRRTKVPLLVVPLVVPVQAIRKIVFAVDDQQISAYGVVWPLARIAKTNKAEIMVYHLDQGAEDGGINPMVDRFLEGIESTYHTTVGEGKIHDNINQFVQANAADMLCMIRRQKGFFTRLFNPSTIRKEVFNCSVPLLVLHDEEQKI